MPLNILYNADRHAPDEVAPPDLTQRDDDEICHLKTHLAQFIQKVAQQLNPSAITGQS